MYNNDNVFDYLKNNRIDELTVIDLWYLFYCYKYIIEDSQQELFYNELKCLLEKINNDERTQAALENFNVSKDVAKECLIEFKYDNETNIKQLDMYALIYDVKKILDKNKYMSKDDPQFEYIMFIDSYIENFEYDLKLFYDFIEYQRCEYISLLKKYITPRSLIFCDMNKVIYASYYDLIYGDYYDDIKEVMTKLKKYTNIYQTISNYGEFKEAKCGSIITTKGEISCLKNYNNVLLGVICRYYRYGFFLDYNSINKINEEYNNKVRELNKDNIPPYINIFKTKARLDRNTFNDLSYKDYMFIVLKYINKDIDIFYEVVSLFIKALNDGGDNMIPNYYSNVEHLIREMDKRNRLYGVFFKSNG